jgi:dihydroorotate dehydrogenase electron transfer subunit
MTAPFGRRHVLLNGRREIGPYVVLTTRDGFARADPGQFYMLAAAERWGGGEGERPFLGRAVSVMRTGEDGLVEFFLEDVGPGTKRLCELEVGEGLLIVGPLGHGFSEPPPDTLLVGGGIGIAPLVAVQDRWGGTPLLGFRDAHHAEAAALFNDPTIATDDGSAGHHGLVTDLLELERGHAGRALYACGPPAMLAALLDRVRQRDTPSEFSIETPMACGFGACYGCVVATVDGYCRACLDGPVFDARTLA